MTGLIPEFWTGVGLTLAILSLCLSLTLSPRGRHRKVKHYRRGKRVQ